MVCHVTSDLNYFGCKDVLEVLKKLDGDGTTLFGHYVMPRVKVTTWTCTSSFNL